MEYKGFKYVPWQDWGDDNVKIFHDVESLEGEIIHFDYCPYKTPSEKEFRLWIDLGMPDRRHKALEYEGRNVYCPLDLKDLEKIKQNAGK